MNGLLAGLGMLGGALLAGSKTKRFYLDFDSSRPQDKDSAISVLLDAIRTAQRYPKISGMRMFQTEDGYEILFYEF